LHIVADLGIIYILHGNTGPTAPTANNTKPFTLLDVVKSSQKLVHFPYSTRLLVNNLIHVEMAVQVFFDCLTASLNLFTQRDPRTN
jgi:hypothetical protein